MSAINVSNIAVLDNPGMFLNPYQFEIMFECSAPLDKDLEWKLIYVGSAESEAYDQVLDSIYVGPVGVGLNRFIFQAPPPNIQLIPADSLLGVTVVLITCSYNEQEFIRIGYYVNVEQPQDEPGSLEDPAAPAAPEPSRQNIDATKLTRNILASKPCVTRFEIEWS